jgi:hypothetical protein
MERHFHVPFIIFFPLPSSKDILFHQGETGTVFLKEAGPARCTALPDPILTIPCILGE